jgi:hypothetical protein
LDIVIHYITELLGETPLAVLYFYAANIFFFKLLDLFATCALFGSTYLREQLFSLMNSEMCLTNTALSLIVEVASKMRCYNSSGLGNIVLIFIDIYIWIQK